VIQGKTGATLVVLAAGLGTRFGGLKQLKPLGPGGNVLLEYTAYDAIRAGFRDIVFIIQSPFADEFKSLVRSLPNDVTVRFAYQDKIWPMSDSQYERTKPWGTGHALAAVQELVHGPFVLCNADDYYGRTAFATAAEFFHGLDSAAAHYGMLGYRLAATLSDHGSVSRAVCAVSKQGNLTSIAEHPKILREDDVIISEQVHGERIRLNESDRVSMNFWMLTPSIFEHLNVAVQKFVEEHRHEPAAECRLPDVIEKLMQGGFVAVDCLPHDDPWFGLTQSADFASASDAVALLHDNGTYPTPLWQQYA
jgi:NDP-sugar pyrophosphorylase family protein